MFFLFTFDIVLKVFTLQLCIFDLVDIINKSLLDSSKFLLLSAALLLQLPDFLPHFIFL